MRQTGYLLLLCAATLAAPCPTPTMSLTTAALFLSPMEGVSKSMFLRGRPACQRGYTPCNQRGYPGRVIGRWAPSTTDTRPTFSRSMFLQIEDTQTTSGGI
jgi:hypothetical protein